MSHIVRSQCDFGHRITKAPAPQVSHRGDKASVVSVIILYAILDMRQRVYYDIKR